MKIVAIIYVQDISRVDGGAVSNISMFRRAIGNQNISDVNVVTAQWDKVSSTDGDAQQTRLRTDHNLFGSGNRSGVTTWKYDINRPKCAREIVESIARNSTGVLLNIQEEIIKKRKRLDQTQAGDLILEDTRGSIRQEKETFKKAKQKLTYKERGLPRPYGEGSKPSRITKLVKEIGKVAGLGPEVDADTKEKLKELEDKHKRAIMEREDTIFALKTRVTDTK